MHDMLGTAGMLRGWVGLWTAQMLWMFAGISLSVAALAVAEVVASARLRQQRVKAAVPVVFAGQHKPFA